MKNNQILHVSGHCVIGDALLKRKRRRRRRHSGEELDDDDSRIKEGSWTSPSTLSSEPKGQDDPSSPEGFPLRQGFEGQVEGAGEWEEEIDLINLIDLISKQDPNTNDKRRLVILNLFTLSEAEGFQDPESTGLDSGSESGMTKGVRNDKKERERLKIKLGIGKLDVGHLLDQLEQLEIRNLKWAYSMKFDIFCYIYLKIVSAYNTRLVNGCFNECEKILSNFVPRKTPLGSARGNCLLTTIRIYGAIVL